MKNAFKNLKKICVGYCTPEFRFLILQAHIKGQTRNIVVPSGLFVTCWNIQISALLLSLLPNTTVWREESPKLAPGFIAIALYSQNQGRFYIGHWAWPLLSISERKGLEMWQSLILFTIFWFYLRVPSHSLYIPLGGYIWKCSINTFWLSWCLVGWCLFHKRSITKSKNFLVLLTSLHIP